MKTNVLENKSFVLGVEESWDSYHEIEVKFVKELRIDTYSYYIFEDTKTKQTFYLSPRYTGHHIEGIFADRQIVVNISKRDTNSGQTNTKPPQFYAIGILQVP